MSKPSENPGYDRLRATLALDGPVTSVPLVSAKRAQALRKLSITTVRDLLANYPRRYIDRSVVRTIRDAVIGESCTIKARVYEVKVKKPKPRLALAEVTLTDPTGTLIVTAFRQPWLADTLKQGTVVAISGTMEFNYGYKRMTNPYIEPLEGEGEGFTGVIIPVHPLTGDIKAGMMRRLIANGLTEVAGLIDPLPLALRAKYRLMSRQSALGAIQFPRSMEEQREARRRLAYEEVLLLELKLMGEGANRSREGEAWAHRIEGRAMAALGEAVPFALTDEQIAARKEILSRLGDKSVANHMLLGDVGTGKTIVAAFALAAASDSGTQALFMAPTEVLAQQHSRTLGPLLDAAGISWALLTGSTPKDEREAILARAAAGELCVLLGTHALLEPDVVLARCSLVIIDEQQRFGVAQRQALLEKGEAVDALYLTATPIPRSLALALFGNLSLSYLHDRPIPAPPRVTSVHGLSDKGRAYDAAGAALLRGEQVYVVCPLIGVDRVVEEPSSGNPDEGDGQTAYEYGAIAIEDDNDYSQDSGTAAQSHARFLQEKVFPDARVGLLHGRMASDDKKETMKAFRQGEIDVLVATTVIEVGVDVPNATVMIIEDADRFGLSQLHQLRGRVGRGSKAGEVHLISGSKSDTALSRLRAMEKTDDGFELASYDLSLRREGDILGNRQHGSSLLKLVNIVRDSALIEAAWQDARTILEEDPDLESELYRPLAREAAVVYRREEQALGA